jgi:hypothetical protein
MRRMKLKTSHCAIDDRNELIYPCSVVCFECGHVHAGIVLEVSPDFCPLCLHDW